MFKPVKRIFTAGQEVCTRVTTSHRFVSSYNFKEKH